MSEMMEKLGSSVREIATRAQMVSAATQVAESYTPVHYDDVEGEAMTRSLKGKVVKSIIEPSPRFNDGFIIEFEDGTKFEVETAYYAWEVEHGIEAIGLDKTAAPC